jgi:hypothetical protein
VHERKQVKPSVSLPAQVMPEQQFGLPGLLGPHALLSMAQVSSQTFALLSERGRHTVPGQSASVPHRSRQVRVSALCPAQTVFSQHEGLFGPHAAPVAPQLQYWAAAQKPVGLFEKGTQQPVSH